MVIALLRAGSLYSRQHAQHLSELRDRLFGVDVVGVNSYHWPSRLMASQLAQLTNYTILQSGSGVRDAWSRLGGLQDDVFVYDRCGRLAYYVPFPASYHGNRFVEAAVLQTLQDAPCGL